MSAWMSSIADLVRSRLGRSPACTTAAPRRASRPFTAPRHRSRAGFAAAGEVLEGRALLAAAVTPFATLPGIITSTGTASQVTLQLAPGELRSSTSPTVILGFNVEPAPGATDSPTITKITGPSGTITPLSPTVHGNTAVDKVARATHEFARIIPLTSSSQDITLNVATLNKKTGSYIVEVYLAGDVNGDGTVDSTDLSLVQAAYGSSQGQANYTAAADFNGDGRIGCIDRTLTVENQGAQVVLPAATTTTTASSLVSLATPVTEVNLYPTQTTTTPIAVATPVAVATGTTTGYVPITLTPATAVPVATATTTPVATTMPTVGTTPIYYTTGTTAATTPVYYSTGTTTAATGTPVYVVPQSVASTTATTGTTAAPIYLYGQPVVAGTNGTTTGTVSSTLFGQTTTGTTTGTTPVPVYLYNAPTYTPSTYKVAY